MSLCLYYFAKNRVQGATKNLFEKIHIYANQIKKTDTI